MSVAIPMFGFGNEVGLHAIPDLMTVTSAMAQSYGSQLFPTDPIGSMTLTLTNVVVGSRVNIRDQAGATTIHDSVAATSSVVISIPVYAVGSSLNDLRIKVRKASGSPNYIPYETLTTAVVGAQSIYVSQIPDE